MASPVHPPNKESEHRQNERAVAQWTRTLGIFTIVLAVASLISNAIALFQLAEMHSAGEDTKVTLKILKDQAEAAKDQAHALEENTRAWVMAEIMPAPYFRDFSEKTVKISFTIGNMGKVPAQNVVFETKSSYQGMKNIFDVKAEDIPDLGGCLDMKDKPGRDLFPGHSFNQVNTDIFTVPADPQSRPQDAVDYNTWKKGKAIYLTRVCIAYLSSGKLHHTETCQYIYHNPQEDFPRYVQCPVGNKLD